MDQFLYGIPVIGLVFEFIGYLIAVLPVIAPIILPAAVPIAFAALCGVMCERSGVVNIGIEGTMLVAAFVGWSAGVFLLPILGSDGTGRSSAPRRRWSSRSLLAVLRGGHRLGRARLAVDHPSGPTRSSAARSSTSPRSGSPAT